MKKIRPSSKKIDIEPGSPMPLGAIITPEGINFAIFSRHAEKVVLVLFNEAGTPTGEITLDLEHNKTGDVWHILLRTRKHDLQYCYRVSGPYDPRGEGHFFDEETLLLDPYTRALSGGETWNGPAEKQAGFKRRCLIIDDHFDWEGDRPLNIPLEDSIIY